MYDYSQVPKSKEYLENYDRIFTPFAPTSIEEMKENAKRMLGKSCHYSQDGGKYVCLCKYNICKKDVKK